MIITINSEGFLGLQLYGETGCHITSLQGCILHPNVIHHRNEINITS